MDVDERISGGFAGRLEMAAAAARELRDLADWIGEDVDLGLTVEQKLAITKRLVKISENLNP